MTVAVQSRRSPPPRGGLIAPDQSRVAPSGLDIVAQHERLRSAYGFVPEEGQVRYPGWVRLGLLIGLSSGAWMAVVHGASSLVRFAR